MMKEDIFKLLYNKTHVVKCSKCGKTMEIPSMFGEKVRNKVLSPYCPSAVVFDVQWIIHHGWHIRNLGIGDSHPYFCPDCFEEGTPEYAAHEYGKQWCEQAEVWLKSEN